MILKVNDRGSYIRNSSSFEMNNNTDEVLYQLSYQANWELVIL